MGSKSPKELMKEAMSMGQPDRVPVMCQLAIGHAILKSGVHPMDYFLYSNAYAEGLIPLLITRSVSLDQMDVIITSTLGIRMSGDDVAAI